MVKNNVLHSTKSAAAFTGFSVDHIRRLILEGKIVAEKVGWSWVIEEKALKDLKRRRRD